MTDMEKVIEKALQYVPMVDASQARIREIQAQKIAQALTSAGYGESEDTQRSEASQPVLPGELVEAVRFAKRFAENIARHRDDGDEYAASDVVTKLEAALSSLPDPLPTVESVRAEERERLIVASRKLGNPHLRAVRTHIQNWLRSQKDTTHDQ